MIFKNLFRRRGRTILTLLGIAIAVATIVALGSSGPGAAGRLRGHDPGQPGRFGAHPGGGAMSAIWVGVVAACWR